MAKLELVNLNKIYPDGSHIIKDINLIIEEGEFAVFVGPSGCGKSTLLRMIAGLEEITSGDMFLNNQKVNHMSPTERGIGMVFQSYALYPHMSVFDNIAFGLKLAKKSTQSIKQSVMEVAEMLELTKLLKQKPSQLSGGQRQRVAIGRAIVKDPTLFLLDEPLSNLDASLRVRMRLELAQYHSRLKSTVVYVTHDQIEAMTLADKIVVLKNGKIEQMGTPLELYYFPDTVFVAGFIGSPNMNLLPVTLVEPNANCSAVKLGDYEFHADVDTSSIGVNSILTFGVRPEDIHLASEGTTVTVKGIERLGTESLLYTKLLKSSKEVVVRVPGTIKVEIGQTLKIQIPPEKCHLFNQQGRALPRQHTIHQLLSVPPDIS